MTSEIPLWVNGTIRWVSGVDKRTTCRDVVEVLLLGEGMGRADVKDYVIMERWRRVEKPLQDTSRILKVWSHWGDEQRDVRLCLKKVDTEVDSGRGSPSGPGNTPSLRRRRRSRFAGKPPETLHPKRLAELGGFDRDAFDDHQMRRLQAVDDKNHRKKSGDPLYDAFVKRQDVDAAEYRRRSCPGTGTLHSTLISPEDSSKPTTSKCCSKRPSKQKVRKSENIEKLMKLILAQGATIQTQLQKLKDREDQIETLEHDKHRERLEKDGRNYLLETYLGSLGDAEVPDDEEEKGNDSGVHTEGGSDQMNPAWEKGRVQDQAEREREVKRVSRRGRLKGGGGDDGHCDEYKAAAGAVEGKPRAKSESRSPGEKEECNMKRTQSETTLVQRESEEQEAALSDTKDGSEEIELQRVQSQVEMWEKVYKINKKLEREEENLVRLHVKIRRCQTESVKLAKEMEEQAPGEASDPRQAELRSAEDCLATLRSDLDQNSKEIYKNFTQLIRNDEEVESKQKYLSKLMSDLKRTEEESEMLEEMVGKAEDHVETTSFSEPDIGISLQVKGQERQARALQESGAEGTNICQRGDEEVENKPKTVKISFEDQIQDAETSGGGSERTKERGAIKGILKNRTTASELMERCNLQLQSLEKASNHGSNIDQEAETKELAPKPLPPPPYQIYSCPVSPGYNNPIYGDNPYRYPFNGRKWLHRKAEAAGGQAGPAGQAGATLVTTKAVVHNDTDSSTSSDTSGLSSMYSSSPTVEEHYIEPRYTLDTLV